MRARDSGRATWPGASLSRRDFLRRSGQAGVAAGVIGWSTPSVRSVDVRAAAGTPDPRETTTTAPTVQNTVIPGTATPQELVLPGVQEAPSSGGGLAFTGAELGSIAAIGSASVGVGEIIRRKGKRKRIEVEAEAEANAERERARRATGGAKGGGAEPGGPAGGTG
jgi:hypothetical protein